MTDFFTNIYRQIVTGISGWGQNPAVLAAQIIAIFASLLNCLGYVFRKRTAYLLDQVAVNATYGVQYALLGGISAVVNNAINIVKLLVFDSYERKNKEYPKWIIAGFCAISVVIGFFTFDGAWVSAVPHVIAVLFTIALSQKDPLLFRGLLVLCNGMWLFYNLYVGAYVAELYTLAEFTVGVAMLIREIVKPTASKNVQADRSEESIK